MYGHPDSPDPYSERQPIPAYADPDDPSGYISVLAVAVVIVITAAGGFSLGYMAGVWGWL